MMTMMIFKRENSLYIKPKDKYYSIDRFVKVVGNINIDSLKYSKKCDMYYQCSGYKDNGYKSKIRPLIEYMKSQGQTLNEESLLIFDFYSYLPFIGKMGNYLHLSLCLDKKKEKLYVIP